MIEKDLKEEVRASVIPILLGDGAKAYRLCGALYKTLGMVSLRIGKRRGFADLLGLTCVFRKACAHDRLFCEQLLSIAEEFGDYLLLLIPTDDASRRYVATMRGELESRFIVCDYDRLTNELQGSVAQTIFPLEEGYPKQT